MGHCKLELLEMDYERMTSTFLEVLRRSLLVFGVTLPASILATLVLAQEFHSGGSQNHGRLIERTPHVQSVEATPQLRGPAPGESVLAPRSGGAIAAPRLKGSSMGADQASDAAVSDDVLLPSVQRISIKMHNYPGLSGDYRINADQTVSIPVLGRIQVSNMTAAGLERLIVEITKTLTGEAANVSVEVAEYRSVFVNGYVEKAGSIPWTPGMTVLQAESLSGGLYRPRFGSPGGGFDPDVDRIKHLTEIKRHTADLKHTLANLARASAERDNVTPIDVPRRLVELVGDAEAKALIDIQTKQLQLYEDSYAAERASLAQADALEAEKIAQLKEQQDLVKRQIDMRDEQLRLLKGARLKGAITQERLLSVESLLATLQEKNTLIIVADAGVRSAAVSLKRDSERLIQGRQLELAKEVEKLERDAARLELDLAAANEGYAMYVRLTGDVGGPEDGTKGSVVHYEITRRKGGETQTILADRLSSLWPGDILVVSLRAASTPLAQSQ